MNTATQTVVQIGQMNFTGNVIPHTWYQHIRKTSMHSAGKGGVREIDRPYLEAIVILSDIIYWYRPQILRDETTGQVVAINRRFKADKLQRSYQQLADMFGLGKDQARDAVKFLEKAGLITTEFRTLIVQGVKLSNVLYIEPVPTMIAKINTPVSLQTDTPQSTDLHSPSLQTDTNTETSQETTQIFTPPGGEKLPKTETDELFGPAQETPPKTAEQYRKELQSVAGSDPLSGMLKAKETAQAKSWTVPGVAGGANDWERVADAFCCLQGIRSSDMPPKKQSQWARKLQAIGEEAQATPEQVIAAIRILPDTDLAFKVPVYTTPYKQSFEDDIAMVIAKMATGQDLRGETYAAHNRGNWREPIREGADDIETIQRKLAAIIAERG